MGSVHQSSVGDTISDMTLAPLLTLVTASLALVRGQSFGPVDLEAVDPLSLSWNQIHWLVRDQIKEVEELKAEHDEIYNEIAGCYGLEKCLGEFDLVDIQPGTKLWNLGLRKVDLSTSELSRQRDELEEMRIELSHKMKQRQMALIRQEELRIQELQRQKEEIRRHSRNRSWRRQERPLQHHPLRHPLNLPPLHHLHQDGQKPLHLTPEAASAARPKANLSLVRLEDTPQTSSQISLQFTDPSLRSLTEGTNTPTQPTLSQATAGPEAEVTTAESPGALLICICRLEILNKVLKY